MLSNQTCTNQIGHHRRQQSTPTLSTLDRPLLPRTPQNNERHRRGLSVDKIFTNAVDPEERNAEIQNGHNNIRQQDGQPQVQETQQTRAWTSQISYSPQAQPSAQILDMQQRSIQQKEQGYLSVEDIDALIMGLDPTADQSHEKTKGNALDSPLDLPFPYDSTQRKRTLCQENERERVETNQHCSYDGVRQPQEATNCPTIRRPELGSPVWDRPKSLTGETNLGQHVHNLLS